MTDVTDFYEYDTCGIVDRVKKQELESIDFEGVVYSTDLYEVAPTITLSISGEPIVKYGIYNKATCVIEAEASQLVTAKSWCNALTEAEQREEPPASELPGLGGGAMH